jgi:hypothetical protein
MLEGTNLRRSTPLRIDRTDDGGGRRQAVAFAAHCLWPVTKSAQP